MYSNALGFVLSIVLMFGIFFFFLKEGLLFWRWLGVGIQGFIHFEMISLATKERANLPRCQDLPYLKTALL